MGIGVLPPSVSQQTPAVRNGIAKAAGKRGGRTTQRRRKSAAAARPAAKKRRAKAAGRKGKKARLVKGSPAAKAYMAKIRRKRK